ncbi:MAG: phospholipase D-like domain-containing protein [Bacteroidota bacterium]
MNLSRLVFLFLSFPGPLLLCQPRIWSSAPYEQAIDSTSVTLVWRTLLPADSRVRYGLTDSLELDEVYDSTVTSQHVVPIVGLIPSTIYRVQFSSTDSIGTSTGPLYTVSTASPSTSTGTINVYFNKNVETSIATGQSALANQRLDLRLIDRIDSASYSIDCALFSLSATPGDRIANALIAARDRGVKVRVVMEASNSGSAPAGKLRNNEITMVTDDFGSNSGAGLHHNKFFVFDYRDIRDSTVSSAADDWVWTGSWNPTGAGTFSDFQDAIEIQDQALAGAFTREFEEMWGSETDTADASRSKFGVRKTDNTPHVFAIAGRRVRLFFSPSDGTSTQINLTLGSADHSIAFALLLITDNSLADALVSKRQQELKVRGVIDDDDPTFGGDFNLLKQNGVDVLLDPNPGLLHHKYAIVDGEFADSTPWVIVGSHNWTASADSKNDENTLLIQDAQIANLFLQEFAARYYEAGGQDSIVVPLRPRGGSIPTAFKLYQNFPNPFNPTTKISFELPRRSFVSLTVFNVLGEEVATLVSEEFAAGRYLTQWNASGIASGVYFYRLVAEAVPSGQPGGFVQSKKLMLMR